MDTGIVMLTPWPPKVNIEIQRSGENSAVKCALLLPTLWRSMAKLQVQLDVSQKEAHRSRPYISYAVALIHQHTQETMHRMFCDLFNFDSSLLPHAKVAGALDSR
jgi:hypothetical protein